MTFRRELARYGRGWDPCDMKGGWNIYCFWERIYKSMLNHRCFTRITLHPTPTTKADTYLNWDFMKIFMTACRKTSTQSQPQRDAGRRLNDPWPQTSLSSRLRSYQERLDFARRCTNYRVWCCCKIGITTKNKGGGSLKDSFAAGHRKKMHPPCSQST